MYRIKINTSLFLQRFPADKAYYIAKELLMTERTYKKDLEVITVVGFLHGHLAIMGFSAK